MEHMGDELVEFAQRATAMQHHLFQDPELSDSEMLFIENQLQGLTIAYGQWKRRWVKRHAPAKRMD